MKPDYSRFRNFLKEWVRPRWEKSNSDQAMRIGGGENFIQFNVLQKAAPFMTEQQIAESPRESVFRAISNCQSLLAHFEANQGKVFVRSVSETDLTRALINLLFSKGELAERISRFLDFSSSIDDPKEKKRARINPTVISYLLAISSPKEYAFCKPTVYQYIVQDTLSKSLIKNNPIERIIHCNEIYKEIFNILNSEYSLEDGNLLDVHSLCYLYRYINVNSNQKPRYWQIAPGEGGRLWDDLRDHSIAAVGFSEIDVDLEDIAEDDLSDLFNEKYPDFSEHKHKVNYKQLWEFINIKPGDKIITNRGKRKILAIGNVISGYKFQPERDEYKHTIGVQYDSKSNEGVDIPESLKGKFGKTILELTENDFKQLVRAFNSGQYIAPVPDTKPVDIIQPFPMDEAITDLFVSDEKFHHIIERIKLKKNLVLQGPPGVGKTFIARRVAYALMGAVDRRRVAMIQFHQSYSYEDFMQGFRPNSEGRFDLRNGAFFDFCKKAEVDPENNPYVFIIDEINRGNLSKIFGEMFMLIEADKRGPDYAMPLAYAKSLDDTFFIPENLYIIGTMNTADRSLAMVDYALRRRFCFINLEPAFDNIKFQDFLESAGVKADVIEKIIDRMGQLNKRIAEDQKNLGPGYCVGHSFFCPSDNNQVYDEAWYKNVILTEIAPLLEEYWFDDPDMAQKRVDQLF